MPDAPAPTVTLAFTLATPSWEAAQATVTGAEPPAGPPEFAAVDVRVGAETLRLEGPGATVEVHDAGTFRVGRRVTFDFDIESPAGTLVVTPRAACAFLGLIREYHGSAKEGLDAREARTWQVTSGTALLRALYESEEAIPEAALTAMAAGPVAGPEAQGPEPEPPAADTAAGDHPVEHEAEPAQTESPAEEPAR